MSTTCTYSNDLEKILKSIKCPKKNQHPSENLAIGTLMYLQKKLYILKILKNKKKIQKQKKQKKCLGENLETGALVAKIQKNYKKS